MAREFRLPDIGEGLTEAEIVRWLIAEGDYVDADQPLVEVETDKAVVEIPSPYAGIVVRHGGEEGQVVEVGSVLVVIEEAAVEASGPSPTNDIAPVAPPSSSSAPPIVGKLDEDAEDVTRPLSAPASDRPHDIRALPLVRKMAREAGIDLATIQGSGPGGRITREDVETVIEGRTHLGSQVDEKADDGPDLDPRLDREAEAEPPPRSELEPEPIGAGERIVAGDSRQRMSRLRRTIAANMAKSWAEVPHVTTFDDVDAGRLLDVRDALGHRFGEKVPLEALLIKAVVPALREFPEFNATLDGEDLVVHGALDIGIAVDTPDGLLVAVLRDAETSGVMELAQEVRRLGEGAKTRSLKPDELAGQTFTVSNIGAVGGGHGTPIVPPGTTAILSVGRAQQKPVVDDGELIIAPVMPLSLSYDHRVIDGGLGRRFMARLIENLEEPALFLAS